ncbi:UDP-N-acetylmuramate--L-alanine ligase [Alicyclobacillus fastidiosus]|uniref:UDP-N-acetylmuramate--L-alanine ligase n=1 Tax=Alicyclobacillus fastidiosus TaxID=392011 RepID=A0ABY6ZMS3_9BACL|nr:UDP-N-acetylmuramate--L-alanine ligase [Alicyclobacillus fastidiosus]WAH44248.1 UDP-N-acetylmuramate--L-alanine ligase [Alicyclobacillus fastidiosus]GMA60568.1 UDP-N-acetylmuramate--L-alanine ligase [Alicyclobacillus fastidiosus]
MRGSQHVHFVGIGGYGMSAIARVMLDLGYQVSGSDVSRQELTDRLAARGANIFYGHDGGQVEGADIVVHSTAVKKDNVELLEARARNIPVIHRSEMLARLMQDRIGVAVTGAHGKTTTTSMIAYMMERNNLDPTFVIGGVVSNIGDNAKAGGGQFVVAEADESDGSFLHYRPAIAVVTNVEADHLEHYDGKFENLKNAYRTFIQQIPESGLAVLSADDVHLQELKSESHARVVTYGFSDDAFIQARNVQLLDRTSSSEVYVGGEFVGRLLLSLPGEHNVLNALAAVAVGREAGLSFNQIAMALAEFHGAKRRFQVIAEANNLLVIDDYAHHPTEISATIAAAKATGRRIVAVFQPQRYTRTYFLFDAFARSFSQADEVIISEIYSPAGEQQIEGVTAERLAAEIRKQSNPRTQYLGTQDEIFAYLRSSIRPGDLVLTMGAGDIWKVAERLGDDLERTSRKALV